ncbi:MAG: O-methyltransferase [Bacilli bacterium]|nr:O-methyltransferase [Bacilli bacterium]
MDYAEENKIPIMQQEGIIYLTNYIENNNIHSVLEIGTAIGFSAIMMALTKDDIHITSIEKDEERYMEALKNVKKLGLEDKITLLYKDALEVSLNNTYDCIFIDAAKSKNTEFFEKFSPKLNEHGTIITDNMKFHGYVDKDESEIKNRNLRGLVRKVKEYREFLKNNKKFETDFLDDIGDGIAVSRKREEK